MKNAFLLGALSLFLVPAALDAQTPTTVTAAVTNGVLNPTQFAGADIGAQVNTALASGYGKTVRIPAGTYTFTTTMNHPGAGYEIQCDTGTTLQYTGTGDAIALLNNPAGAQAAGIDGSGGCLIQGTATAVSAIHLGPSNHTFVRNLRITGFSNGYGIYVTGANHVNITDNSITYNRTGIELTGAPAYAANAIHIERNEIASNTNWGASFDQGPAALSLGVVIRDNVFEGNNVNGSSTLGDLNLNWNHTTLVEGNYFESSGILINVGSSSNALATAIRSNYFTTHPGVVEAISIGYGLQWNISDNGDQAVQGGTSTGCFINITTGPYGGVGYFHGGGTNYVSEHEWCNHGASFTP